MSGTKLRERCVKLIINVSTDGYARSEQVAQIESFAREILKPYQEAIKEADDYMYAMTDGPGDAPGMWLRRYGHLKDTTTLAVEANTEKAEK